MPFHTITRLISDPASIIFWKKELSGLFQTCEHYLLEKRTVRSISDPASIIFWRKELSGLFQILRALSFGEKNCRLFQILPALSFGEKNCQVYFRSCEHYLLEKRTVRSISDPASIIFWRKELSGLFQILRALSFGEKNCQVYFRSCEHYLLEKRTVRSKRTELRSISDPASITFWRKELSGLFQILRALSFGEKNCQVYFRSCEHYLLEKRTELSLSISDPASIIFWRKELSGLFQILRALSLGEKNCQIYFRFQPP